MDILRDQTEEITLYIYMDILRDQTEEITLYIYGHIA